MALNISYMYDYITKIYRKQAEVAQNHVQLDEKNPTHRKHKRLKLGGGETYGR
jgi:hypothetical protein